MTGGKSGGYVQAYHFCSRTLVPLLAVYAAGQAIGRLLYVASGHLGMFVGPLGDLRRAFLGSPSRHSVVHPEDVFAWLPALVFAYLLIVESARQARHRQNARGGLFLCGIALTFLNFVVPLIGAHFGWQTHDGVLTVAVIGAGAALVASRWARWRRQNRALAAAVAAAGFVIGVVLFRLHDSLHLRSAW